MKKHISIFCAVFASAIFALVCCNEPVFWSISQAVEPADPRIEGGPTNFAVFKDAVYVATGSSLHKYTGGNSEGWNNDIPPGGRIVQIASTGEYLFALCYRQSSSNIAENTVLKRFDGGKWEELEGSGIQQIYAAGDKLFFGTGSSSSFTLHYVDNSETPSVKNLTGENVTGDLRGAAFDGTDNYICTTNNGVFRMNSTSGEAVSIPILSDGEEKKSSSEKFTGMINLGGASNTILLITRNGRLFTVKGDNLESVENVSLGNRMSTGALAIWIDKDDDSKRLLLAGRQDSLVYSVNSGYTYGYLELELDYNGVNGIKAESQFREPGIRTPSSVIDGDNERYKSTIGKYPVNFIFQTPQSIESDMILFASTQKNGVWSYRQRKGGPQWNAEE